MGPFVVTALGCFIVLLCNVLYKWARPGLNQRKQTLLEEIKRKREEAEEVNTPGTFAAYAKLEREIRVLQAQCSSMQEYVDRTLLVRVVLLLLPYLSGLFFVYSSYPMEVDGFTVFWPFWWMLGHQTGTTFYLSGFRWYFISIKSLKPLLNRIS